MDKRVHKDGISVREFRNNLKLYLDKADIGEVVKINRSGGSFYLSSGEPENKNTIGHMIKKVQAIVANDEVCEHGREVGLCPAFDCPHNPNT